jgi:hypothetical protein
VNEEKDNPFSSHSLAELGELRNELRRTVCQRLALSSPVFLPGDPDPAWSPDLRKLFDKMQAVDRCFTTRYQRIDQRRLSAFMKGINSPEGPSAEAMRWWLNRY